MTLAEFASLAKDLGIGLLILFVFYRHMGISSQADKRSDDNQKSLINLNALAVKAMDKIEQALYRVGESQQRSSELLEKAERRAEQTLDRHTENGANILEGNRIQREVVQQLTTLALNFANYNKLVDGTVAGLSGNVAEMNSTIIAFLGRMDAVEIALTEIRESCQDTVTKDHLETLSERVIGEFHSAKEEILAQLTTLEADKSS